jgi:mRNA interferase MazF
MVARRFEVYLVNLAPTLGTEIQKMPTCLVISPDEMNAHLATVIIAPMTTQGRDYPSRVSCQFEGKAGQVVLDQIRTVDRSRLVKKMGKIDAATQNGVLAVLSKMFAE